jgi:endonuclease YncB( thermonuclease family)
LPANATHAAEKVYVLDAVDGDQVQLQRANGSLSQVHLIGIIQAPGTRSEKRHPSKLHFGQTAFGRWDTAVCDPWERPKNKKKPAPPLLCRMEVDGTDLSAVQLEAGFATYSDRYAGSLSQEDRKSFKAKEQAAREAKKIWSDDSSVRWLTFAKT